MQKSVTLTQSSKVNLEQSSTDSVDSSSVKDYFLLMKPRVMSLVVFTAICGIILAPGTISPVIAFATILCVTTGSGAAAALNMWYDRDIDAIMTRTRKRPIVQVKIAADEALSFGIVLTVMSVLMMALCVSFLAAGLLLFTILYYIFIYTMWLKRNSIQNVVIGGVAGALPPMIGVVAVTGEISIEAIILFMIIFLWTPPHSWALAIFKTKDYQSCNVPMMPAVKGFTYTKKQILFYTILLLISSIMPYIYNMGGHGYLIIASIFDAAFLYYVICLFKDDNLAKAKKLFWFSILYLFIIFLSLIIL
ncbi:MAG: protoheme IX farnesyltransferase [Rickettsiaceae bacterium]|nr:protoheme IX farnesyltransferase [Rickettsiaceae bacterium]